MRILNLIAFVVCALAGCSALSAGRWAMAVAYFGMSFINYLFAEVAQ